jgi:uncharacterized lipoprotein YmbA
MYYKVIPAMIYVVPVRDVDCFDTEINGFQGRWTGEYIIIGVKRIANRKGEFED